MIRKFEELQLNAWPSFNTEFLDGWVLRYANGYTKRANSVIPIYSSTMQNEEKIKICQGKYSVKNLPAIFKLTELNQELDKELELLNYKKIDESIIRTKNLTITEKGSPDGINVSKNLTDEWLKSFWEFSDLTENLQSAANNLLKRISNPVICCTKVSEDKVVGVGLGVIDNEHVGLFDIVVDEHYRRKGFGEEIINSILHESVKFGAKTAYLQVVADNYPANCLYDKLGFNELYRYWYRREEK